MSELALLREEIQNLTKRLDANVFVSVGNPNPGEKTNLDLVWYLTCAALVFFMQAGFALLEIGSVSQKNVSNILFKNLADICIGALMWFFLGWGFSSADGDASTNEFIGVTDFGVKSSGFEDFFYSFAFAATAATIVSGSVAERCKLEAYFVYTLVITGFIYPVVVFWVWSGDGWLSFGKKNGIIDFAGSGVVHMVGGLSGLMGAILIKPREDDVKQHSIPFQVLGTLILWFGWYGFNCGSTLGASSMPIATRVASTTTLAAAAAGVTAGAISRFVEGHYSVSRVCNGILAGLVSITANCSVVGCGSAIIIGMIGAFVYYATSVLLQYYRIDDPLDASCVHGFAGMWGVIATGIFATNDVVIDAYGGSIPDDFLLKQLVGVLAISAWTCGSAFVMFKMIDFTIGLRVDKKTEKAGLDKAEHGGQAWNFELEKIKRRLSLSATNSPSREPVNPVVDPDVGVSV